MPTNSYRAAGGGGLDRAGANSIIYHGTPTNRHVLLQ